MDLIGTDIWNCDGCGLTPSLRRDILLVAAEMYDSWEACDRSLRWDRVVRGLVETDPNPVTTLGDFFSELTGERHPLLRSDLLDYSDDFGEWLKEFICDEWGDAAFEEDDDGDSDPLSEAELMVFEWLNDLRIVDVLAWRIDDLRAEEATFDWKATGF